MEGHPEEDGDVDGEQEVGAGGRNVGPTRRTRGGRGRRAGGSAGA